MLSSDQAALVAKRVMAQVLNEPVRLVALKDASRLYETWVFRVRVKSGPGAYVCKIGPADEAGRAQMRHQHKRLCEVNGQLTNPALSAPKALEYFDNDCALVMQDVQGATLRQMIAGGEAGLEGPLRQAGLWLAEFHRATSVQAAFEPKPHTNSLRRKIRAHREGGRQIEGFAAFVKGFRQLEALGEMARGQPCLRCVTHRDFHLGNLLFSPDGAVYGIDFENEDQDDALRDLVSYLLDLAVRYPARPADFMALRAAACQMFNAYADTVTAPVVTAYFQRFGALNVWSNLSAAKTAPAELRHRLSVMKALAEQPLFDLP